MPGLVGILVVLAMTVIAPVGLHLLGTRGLPLLARPWGVLGLVAGVALLLPRGAVAACLVVPYAAACAAAACCGVARSLRWVAGHRERALEELAALTATTSLAVAGAALLAERAGHELLGFSLPVLGLTVAHFHVAGFAAVLLAGLPARAVPCGASAAGALAVPAGTALVGVGHFAGRATELAGSVVLAAGLLATSYVVVRRMTGGRRLLLVAAWAAPLTMGLAVAFALGRATGLPHLSVAQTAATHGVLNALAVGLCGLLGWLRLGGRPL